MRLPCPQEPRSTYKSWTNSLLVFSSSTTSLFTPPLPFHFASFHLPPLRAPSFDMFASLATFLALASLAPAAFAAPVLLSGSGSASASVSVSLSTDIVFKAQGFGSDYYKSVFYPRLF